MTKTILSDNEPITTQEETILKHRYCSWCLEKSNHLQVQENRVRRNVYECRSCGNYTLPCRFCNNMAKGAPKGTIKDFFGWDNERCAEHDGSVLSFDKDSIRLKDITDYKQLLDQDTTTRYSFASTIGKHLLSEYFGDDDRFDIIRLTKAADHNADNPLNRVIVINGFLKETDKIFKDWMRAYEMIPDNTEIYGLTWASQTMGDFAKSFLSPKIANIASKKLILAQILYSAATNPWHVSMKKAADAGELLGNILLHSEGEPFTLVAHSLGCRVIYYALEFLKHHPQIKVKDVILLGGAVGNDTKDWEAVADKMSGKIYNCHSDNDDALHKGYNISTLKLSAPIGYYPIKSDHANIINIDCSDIITGHNEWKDEYPEVYERIIAYQKDHQSASSTHLNDK